MLSRDEVATWAELAFEDLCRRFNHDPSDRYPTLFIITGSSDGLYIKHIDVLRKQLLKALESTGDL